MNRFVLTQESCPLPPKKDRKMVNIPLNISKQDKEAILNPLEL